MDQAANSKIIRKQTVEATVIRACVRCGAPGREGLTVCETCGAVRPPDEAKGVIWSREYVADNIRERIIR